MLQGITASGIGEPEQTPRVHGQDKPTRTIRVIGDVHGKLGSYVKLARGAEYSLQLGDLDFNYSWLQQVQLDWSKHVCILGNHDHPLIPPPHSLGDFGAVPFIPESFFVRGAYSIDRIYRTPGWDWFPEEELNLAQSEAALTAYAVVRPRYMFTHDAPAELVPYVTSMPHLELPLSNTQRLLQCMLELHQPEIWLHGHYHTSTRVVVQGTQFQCLNELEYIDMEFSL